MLKNNLIARALVPSLVALSACSHGLPVKEFADTANPTEEVSHLDADIQIAKTNQVDAFSPNHFGKAFEHMDSAKQGIRRKKDSKDILHEVAEGRAHLNRAQEVTQLGRTEMEGVVAARQRAIDAGAPEYFPRTFKDVDDDLKDVGADLEKNNMKSVAKNRTELQAKFLDLELRAIKEARLGPARKTLEQAKGEGAKEYAPRTLAIAEKSVEDTDAYVTANRHNTAEIEKRSQEAREKAEHALKITQMAKHDKSSSPEDAALAMEREQMNAKSKEEMLSEKERELSEGKTEAQRLAAEKRRMEQEKAFASKYEEARALFSEDEAEVFQQGETLIIRLKSLEFPTAQATLKGANFPLLAKVERVLEDFDSSSVIVEGHTDSVGSKQLNQQLSMKRAEVVKDFLVSNVDADLDEIRAVGLSDRKPIASNKTAEGRAQNRRVDVVIRPTDAQEAQKEMLDPENKFEKRNEY